MTNDPGQPDHHDGEPDRPHNEAMAARHTRARPIVSYILIGLCVAVFGLGYVWPELPQRLVFSPWLAQQEPVRFLGSAFLHATPWHLLLNMYALWIIGQGLEPLIGKLRFLALYLMSAIAGNLAVVFLADPTTHSWYNFTVGASGAVFGLFGAVYVINRRFGGDIRSITILLVINLGCSFLIPNISWESHVGGLIGGATLMFLYTIRRNHKWRGALHINMTIALLLAYIVIAMYAFNG